VRLTADQRRDEFRRQSFLLTTTPKQVMLKGGSPWGELDLEARGCVPLIEAMAELGHAPQSIAALEAALPSIPLDDLIARIILLAGVNVLRPALGVDEQKAVRGRCTALNAYILGLPSGESAVLASPVLGAGVQVSPLERAVLAAHASGKRTVADYAEAIERTGLRGRSAHDVAASIHADALPIFRAMGLIEI
jgi:hypothetical protein